MVSLRVRILMNRVHKYPHSQRDLLDGGYCVALTTIMPDGQPQITPVWCNRDGAYVLSCRRPTSRLRSRLLQPISEWKDRVAWQFPFLTPIAIYWLSPFTVCYRP